VNAFLDWLNGWAAWFVAIVLAYVGVCLVIVALLNRSFRVREQQAPQDTVHSATPNEEH
jgi:hypothetical protein